MKKKIISLLVSLVLAVQMVPAVEAAEVSFEDYIVSKIESRAESIDVTSYMKKNGWDKSEVMAQYQQVILDNPQLFYVSGGVSYSAKISGSTIKSATLKNFGYTNTKSEIEAMKKKFDAAAEKALAEIDSSMTDVEKALALHDYLIINCAYDTKLKNYDAYDCLVSKSAVCQGYSLAYKYLLNQAGVECEVITSTSMNHAWNYVKIGTKWYHVDVTMDDPLFNDNGTKRDFFGNVGHEYFLLSDNAIKKASTPHKGWELNGLPKASSTTYNNYFWRDSDAAIVKYGKYWYYLKLNPNSPGLNYSSTKSNEIQTYLYRYSFSTKKSTKIYTIKSTWKLWSNKNSWYLDSYARLAEYNGKIYFNTADSIRYYDVASNKIKTYCKPSTANGYIYGMAVIDGKLKYTIKTAPTAKDSIKYRTLTQ